MMERRDDMCRTIGVAAKTSSPQAAATGSSEEWETYLFAEAKNLVAQCDSVEFK